MKKLTEHGRLAQLDFLRGLAILLVLGGHIFFKPPLSAFSVALFGPLLVCGWTGVDLFFVLSGYLVSSLIFNEYLKRNTFDPWNFLIRRGFKIYPGYYAFLLLAVPLLGWLKIGWTGAAWLHEAFFVQNYFGGIWPQLWSLAVEEHFYLSFCLVSSLLIAAHVGVRAFKYVCLFALVVSPVLRCFATMHPPWNCSLTHLRLDSLAFGVLLSYLRHFESDKLKFLCRKPFFLLLYGVPLVLTGIASFPSQSALGFVFGYISIYVGYGLILLHALHTEQRKEHLYKVVCTIGVYSYSIYLWHKAVNYVLQNLIGRMFQLSLPQELTVVVYFVVAVLWGILAAKLVEMPFLRLRERLFPSKSVSAL